jgi:hypothetical protein
MYSTYINVTVALPFSYLSLSDLSRNLRHVLDRGRNHRLRAISDSPLSLALLPV